MSELPRLLLCSFDVLPAPSGSSRRISEYLRGLSDHFTVVVLSAKTPDHPHIEKFQGARLLRVPVGSGDLVSRLQAFDRAVRRQLESEEYAVVHFTDPFGGYALAEQRESYGYKLVYEAQSFPSQEIRFTHPQLEGDRKFLAKVRRQELFCLMNADRVITGSNVTRDHIQSLGVPGSHVEVLRAPIDLEPFTEEAMGPPDAAPMRVLYLGSQVGWQGLPTLLRAMQHALREVDMRLVIVGPSHTAWQPLLEDLVQELLLGGKVEFQPPVAHGDLHKVLALADVGVVPLDDLDRNRVQGGAVAKAAEYLAAGRPVISADLPSAREVLNEDVALFHEPGDSEDLGECLVELAKNVKRRVRMGKAAFALARANHDANVIRERVREIYSEITGLAPATRGEDDEDAAGPQPTLIGTPSQHSLGTPVTAAPKDKESGTDPVIRADELRGKKTGTEPDSKRGAKSAAAEKRRERRKKRREEPEDNAPVPGTDPGTQQPDAPQVVMGTPLRDESRGTEPGAAPAAAPVVMGTPLRDESRGTEPGAAPAAAPVVMGTPLRDESRGTEPGAAPAAAPVVMGTPLRDEHRGTEPGASPTAPVVMGTPVRDEHRGTEPGASPAGPPVVMGTPVREPDRSERAPAADPKPVDDAPTPRSARHALSGPLVVGMPLEALPQPKAKAPLPSSGPLVVGTPLEALPQPKLPPEAVSKPLVPLRIPGPTVVTTASSTTASSLAPPPVHPPPGPSVIIDADLLGAAEADPADVQSADDEADAPDEISSDEVEEAPSTPVPAGATIESADDAVMGPADDPPEPEPDTLAAAAYAYAQASASAPASTPAPSAPPAAPAPSDTHEDFDGSPLDAWFAQLVHGYCPPEGAQFARPTPPTNFPGREGPPPQTVQPASPSAQSIPSRSDDR